MQQDSNWESACVRLIRQYGQDKWRAEVSADGETREQLVGFDTVLNYYGAFGWEPVSIMMDASKQEGSETFTYIALAFFKRPFRVEHLRPAAGVVSSRSAVRRTERLGDEN